MIAGEGKPASKSIDLLGGCSPAWCLVKVGQVIGWLARERLVGEEAVASVRDMNNVQTTGGPRIQAVAEVPPSAPDRGEPAPVKSLYALLFGEDAEKKRDSFGPQQKLAANAAVTIVQKPSPQPPAGSAAISEIQGAAQQKAAANAVITDTPKAPAQPPARSAALLEDQRTPQQGTPARLAITEIEQKTYSLAGLKRNASLPVYVYHDESSPVLGLLPRNARDVEATGLCVQEWCLVRRGTLRGWIKRRHLTDDSVAGSQKFSFDGPAPWTSLKVHDYPDEKATIVGQITSPAVSIEPIGDCGEDWCHVRYFDVAGWVRSSELRPQ